jgi:hypothetical protein
MCFSYVFDELCCFYAAAMLLVLLCIILAFSVVGISFVWLQYKILHTMFTVSDKRLSVLSCEYLQE